MRMLHGIERRLQGAIDKAFARIFGGSVQPGEVSSALQREAARHVDHQGGRAIAPNRYIVELGPSDHAAVGDDVRRVSDAFTGMLADYVADQGWDTFADVDVSFAESNLLHTGQFRITSLVDPDVGPRSADAEPGLMDHFFDAPAGGHPSRNAGYRPGTAGNDVAPGPIPAAPQQPVSPGFAPPPGYGYPGPPGGALAPGYAAPPESRYTPAPPAGYPREPQPRLVVDDGSDRSFVLQRGSNVVGRGQDAALRLADTSVSRRHIDVYFDGQAAIVHDLGSTNGTMVNGAPVQTWQLADGDAIRIGQSTVVFRSR